MSSARTSGEYTLPSPAQHELWKVVRFRYSSAAKNAAFLLSQSQTWEVPLEGVAGQCVDGVEDDRTGAEGEEVLETENRDENTVHETATDSQTFLSLPGVGKFNLDDTHASNMSSSWFLHDSLSKMDSVLSRGEAAMLRLMESLSVLLSSPLGDGKERTKAESDDEDSQGSGGGTDRHDADLENVGASHEGGGGGEREGESKEEGGEKLATGPTSLPRTTIGYMTLSSRRRLRCQLREDWKLRYARRVLELLELASDLGDTGAMVSVGEC